jgi:hypothetical protein
VLNNFPITKKYIEGYTQSVESEIKKRLKGHGKYASGKLDKSINVYVKETDKSFSVMYEMASYGKFVDKGVEGSETHRAGKGGKSIYKYKNKMPPISKLDSWVVNKKIAPRDKSGKFLSRKSIKFAIARSIFLRGITPTNFFTIPIERRAKQFNEGLERNFAKDLDNLTKGLNG